MESLFFLWLQQGEAGGEAGPSARQAGALQAALLSAWLRGGSRGGFGMTFAGERSGGLGLTPSLSLPGAQASRRSKESAGDATALHQSPGEGAEPPPCRECRSRLGSVPRALVLQPSSRGIASHLLPLLLSCPVEDIQRQEPGDPDRGPGKGENGCLSPASRCAGVPGSLASGVTFCGRVPRCQSGR